MVYRMYRFEVLYVVLWKTRRTCTSVGVTKGGCVPEGFHPENLDF